MKLLQSCLLLFVLSISLMGCLSKEEIIYWIENSVVYQKTKFCVDKDSNKVTIHFDSPSKSMLYNHRIQKSAFLLFSKDYTKLSELKEDLISAIDEDVDIAFVFYRPGHRDRPLEIVSLNYNEVTGHFMKQNGMEAVEDPWHFVVNYNLSAQDIEQGIEIRGAVRLSSPKIEGTVFSKEIVIKSLPYKAGFRSSVAKCDYDPLPPPPKQVPETVVVVKEVPVVVTPKPDAVVRQRPKWLQVGFISPGFRVTAAPERITFDKGGTGWLYLLEYDISLEKVFNFSRCEWTLPDVYDQHTNFYQQIWSPLITNLFDSINVKTDQSNFFSVLLQGSADGGSGCNNKTVGRLTKLENLIHGSQIPYLFKESQGVSIQESGRPWQANSPVMNNDLPYVRAGFIKLAMENSILSESSSVGVVNGQIVSGYSPEDRKVSVYLIQTDFDLANSYPQVFRRLR